MLHAFLPSIRIPFASRHTNFRGIFSPLEFFPLHFHPLFYTRANFFFFFSPSESSSIPISWSIKINKIYISSLFLFPPLFNSPYCLSTNFSSHVLFFTNDGKELRINDSFLLISPRPLASCITDTSMDDLLWAETPRGLRNSRPHKSSRRRGNNKLMLVVKRNRGYSADLTIRRGAFTRKKGDDTCVCVCMRRDGVPDDTNNR